MDKKFVTGGLMCLLQPFQSAHLFAANTAYLYRTAAATLCTKRRAWRKPGVIVVRHASGGVARPTPLPGATSRNVERCAAAG